MADVLRAFPLDETRRRWAVQNLTKGTEYEVDTEQMTCSCPQFEHKRRCGKHIACALRMFDLYFGQPKPGRVATLRALIRQEHGPISPAAEFNRFMELVIPAAEETEPPIEGWSELTDDEKRRVFA